MKTLKKFEFKASTFGARTSNYDWNKLLDGGIYQLTVGDDITGSNPATAADNFIFSARHQTRLQGKELKVNKTEDGSVVIQASESDEGRAEEYKAKLKAANEVYKAKQKAKKEAAAQTA